MVRWPRLCQAQRGALTGGPDATPGFPADTACDRSTAGETTTDVSPAEEVAEESHAKELTSDGETYNKVSSGETALEGMSPEAGHSPDSMGTATERCCHDRPSSFLEYGKSYFTKSYVALGTVPKTCGKCNKGLTGSVGTHVCPEVGKKGSTCEHALCKACHTEATLAEPGRNSRSTRGQRTNVGMS